MPDAIPPTAPMPVDRAQLVLDLVDYADSAQRLFASMEPETIHSTFDWASVDTLEAAGEDIMARVRSYAAQLLAAPDVTERPKTTRAYTPAEVQAW